METRIARMPKSIVYLNVILTVIAILLACRVANDFGFLKAEQAHADNVVSVQIESVRGLIPVSIKEPLSGYPNAVCVSPCK